MLTVTSNGQIKSTQEYATYACPDAKQIGSEVIRSYNNADANDKYKFTEKERDKETNLDYFGARYYDASIGRWLAVDPLASKYPGWSGYNYVMMNPLRLVDPKGMSAEDIYEMDDDGKIMKKCDLPGPDVLYKKGDNKNFIVVNDKDLLPSLSNFTKKMEGQSTLYKGSYAETDNKEEAFGVYKWAADNSNAEWGISGFNIQGVEKYVVSTSRDQEKIYGVTALGNLFYSNLNITFQMHSHQGDESAYASGGLGSIQKGDMDNIKNSAPHYVYDVTNSNTFQYNKTNPSFNVKPVVNSTDIYRNIGR